jgi:two-component system cell cycle sensor histidine kinase/response regulator CckA
VHAAADGLEAIELYGQAIRAGRPYDLLLLDLTVKGGMGGVLTLNRIQEIDPSTKAIVFSGYTDDPVIENFREYGFLDAITKPFMLETLKSVIEKHI